MHYSTFVAPLLLIAPVLAQNNINCSGEYFDNYCCAGGSFVGPVISSFSASVSSRESSLSASLSSASTSRDASQSSLQASLSSRFSNSGINARTVSLTGASDSQITPAPGLRKRLITTEVSSGLTCIGDYASSAGGSGSSSSSGSGSGSGSGTGTGTGAGAASTSRSSAGAAFITQAPMLAMGAAAFAYGAM